MTKQITIETAKALNEYGYTVYLSKDQDHGFYTDGNRVVSFGGQWNWSLDFSGNYLPTKVSGTGWQIARDVGVPTEDRAMAYISAEAPLWANLNPVYTTPEEHLKTYGKSSGYTLFQKGE
jgi:hypothetical protein